MNELELIEDLGIIYPSESSKHKARMGLYRCFCGNTFRALSNDVKRGHTKSCGCYKIEKAKERSTTHGLSSHRLYDTWNNMMYRCNNVSSPIYKDYGGRGIIVCEEWLNVANFIEDMFPSYIEGLELDRINNEGEYSKDNCRWSTKTVQERNTRRIHKHNTSGYRGVALLKSGASPKYMSSLKINGKSKYIGTYPTAIDAAKARDKYIIDNNLEHTKNFE